MLFRLAEKTERRSSLLGHANLQINNAFGRDGRTQSRMDHGYSMSILPIRNLPLFCDQVQVFSFLKAVALELVRAKLLTKHTRPHCTRLDRNSKCQKLWIIKD